MNKLPDFHSNKKYWMILNKLVFGDSVSCPGCENILKQNYRQRYLWCRLCRHKYRPAAYRSSWLYGMKLSAKQLFVLLWCWQNKKAQIQHEYLLKLATLAFSAGMKDLDATCHQTPYSIYLFTFRWTKATLVNVKAHKNKSLSQEP